jgi:hypothetical protein
VVDDDEVFAATVVVVGSAACSRTDTAILLLQTVRATLEIRNNKRMMTANVSIHSFELDDDEEEEVPSMAEHNDTASSRIFLILLLCCYYCVAFVVFGFGCCFWFCCGLRSLTQLGSVT